MPIFRIEVLEENSKKIKKNEEEKMKRMRDRALGLKNFWNKLVSWVLALFLILRNVQRGAAVDT